MSFLKRLFGLGGGGDETGEPAAMPGKTLEHKGFVVRATPFKQDGQFQTCGIISKAVDGVTKEQKFIRADRFPSQDQAADHALVKGRQVIDEQGDRLFD